MEQKYTYLKVGDICKEGDEYESDKDVWCMVISSHFGELYTPLDFAIGNSRYRRPITEQYVYENAGFNEDSISTIDIINIASAVWNGPANFYDKLGNEVTVRGHMNHSIELIADGDPISIQDLHTCQPAPRMMEINGVELVAPETEKPEQGTKYYYISAGMVIARIWGGEEARDDSIITKAGIWLKKEHCKQVIDAMKKVYFGGEV